MTKPRTVCAHCHREDCSYPARAPLEIEDGDIDALLGTGPAPCQTDWKFTLLITVLCFVAGMVGYFVVNH